MEEQLENVLKTLEKDRESLFANADKLIVVNTEEHLKEQAELKRKEEIRRHTEIIAYHIASLVYNTLFNAKVRKDYIKKVDKMLGLLSSGVADTEMSHYIIDENGLIIYLNYSNEFYDFYEELDGYGKCFLDNDEKLDYELLINILANNGISLKREKREEVLSEYSRLCIDILTITYLRLRKVDEKRQGK